MNTFFTFMLSQSILIPLLLGLVRIKYLSALYYPFFILLLLAFLSEVISFTVIAFFKASNAPVIKIYSLIECCLILYQLYVWKIADKQRPVYRLLSTICITVWVVENIVFLNINNFSPFFRVFYAFVLVLLSINQINSLIVLQDGSILKDPRIILCLAFIIFFTYQIIYEASFFIGSAQSEAANIIITGFGYINLTVNLLYAVAVFFMTRKNGITYNGRLKDI